MLADITLPSAKVSDECSSYMVAVNTPFGTLNSNGGTIKDVPVGIYFIEYIAIDDCGDKAICKLKLEVADDDPPAYL